MSVNTNQTAVNGLKDFFARTHKNISSLSQVVPNPLPYNEPFFINTEFPGTNQAEIKGFADTLFIQNPTSTAFTMPNSGLGQVIINHDATETNNTPALFVSSQTQLNSKLILNNMNPSAAVVIPSFNTAGAQQGYYELYNGNTSGSGLQLSTLQLFSYFGGASNQNIQFNPNGTTLVPNGTVSNLLVSSINGAQVAPSGNNATYISSFTAPVTNNSNTSILTFSNVQPNGICEGFLAGYVSWFGATPNAADLVKVGFNGGGPQDVDNLPALLPVAALAVGGNTRGYFTIAGFFETSATATSVSIDYQASVAVPADYSIVLTAGNLRFIGPQ
jgi:hypothetical protein